MRCGYGHARYRVIIFMSLLCFSNGGALSSIQFEAFRYEVLPGYYKKLDVNLNHYGKSIFFGGCFEFLQEIKTFDATFKAMVRTKGKRNLNLLNATYNGCTLIQSIKNLGKKNLIRKIIGGLNHAKFPKTCPMKAHTEYCFANFSLDGLDFPLYLPNVTADFNYSLTQKKDTFYKGFFKVKVQSET
ncbi:uncharacterized protein LOC106091388 [Stomoxys calcitrans]|uniref:Uncharacterized protein n=1 Tax=Stomoxys calcitrans TaxID=35570 RepID=A0A1I8PC24_STOCA|nr:uncharacterized protein LOC106091388 [Stomoxys calcitrans]